MAELLFYHLEQASVEAVLPMLLEKSLERGWRCVVQVRDEKTQTQLDEHLWTFKPASFLAHSLVEDDHAAEVPIFMTLDDEVRPNGAQVRFLVDCGDLEQCTDYERVIYMFDGQDETCVENARDQWKQAKAHGFEATYWQQSEQGRWEKKG